MDCFESWKEAENDALISIVVPVYEVEPYLDRCVSSLCNQTYQKLEIILVDDGSPDSCGTMCDEWAGKDDRIRVIHKSNGGLSDARNAGIAIASGEYIAFADSDDWVSPFFAERLYRVMRRENADIVECGILRTAEEGADFPAAGDDCTVFSAKAAMEELIQDRVFHQHVWNKLYRKDLTERIPFEKGKTNEDEFWTYQIFGKAEKIVKLDDILYCYFQRPTSIMGKPYSLKRLDALEAKKQRQLYIDLKFPELSALAGINLFTSCIYSGQMTLKFLEGDEKKEAIRIINRIQRSSRPDLHGRKRSSGTERLWINLASLNFWWTCRLKNLLGKGF